MALTNFGGYGADPFAMMDPLFFDSACAGLCAATGSDTTDEARAVAGMGGGLDPGLSTMSGSRRRATMPADVLETQVRNKRAQGDARFGRRVVARGCGLFAGADARDGDADASRACSRVFLRARRTSSSC